MSESEIVNYSKLSKEELLDLSFLSKLYETDDNVILSVYENALEDRARELKCLRQIKKLTSALRKERAEIQNANSAPKEKASNTEVEIANMTNFPQGYSDEFDMLNCGRWICNGSGVKKVFANQIQEASLWPILPVCYLKNVHTKVEKVVLAYFKGQKWNYQTLYRSDISSATKIINMSNYGLPVTSKTAPYLVDYLQEIEALNEDIIPHKLSTTKMGWHGKEFMPFSEKIIYDGDHAFNDLMSSFSQTGDYNVWLEAVKKVRASGRTEPLVFLAASFGSPLLRFLGVPTFAVDLWGDTEGGKTVCVRLAASVWADSRSGKYYGDFQSTEVGYEMKQDFLNDLPFIIDDSSTLDKNKANFSQFIYNRCKERGKTRSNVNRGIEADTTWRQIIMMTGEQPFTTETMQGGAINRVLEITCGLDRIFVDPKGLCRVLDANWGFAGKDFIEKLQALDPKEVFQIYEKQFEIVNELDGMQKQSDALAVLLTADILIERLIFQDGISINSDSISEFLADKSLVSENERCYEYLKSMAAINQENFRPVIQDKDKNEAAYKAKIWGMYNDDETELFIIKTIFDKLCAEQHFSSKKFLDWAMKRGKIRCSKDRPTVLKRLPGEKNAFRCICLVLKSYADNDDEIIEDTSTETDGIPF